MVVIFKGRQLLPFLDWIPVLEYYANCADSVKMLLNAVSDQDLNCLLTEIFMENGVKINTPKTRNGFIQMIGMDKSNGKKLVNKKYFDSLVCEPILQWRLL